MTGSLPPAAAWPRAPRSLRPVLAFIAVAALAVAGCAGSAALSPVGGDGEGSPAEAPAAMPSAAPAQDRDGSGSEAFAPGDATAADGQLIVRTGQLDLEVAVLDDALAAAETAVAAAGGYVAASQRQGDGDTAGALVTYRIPAERWDATLAALRAVGTKVLTERTASEEVTAQVVDLAARLVNLRATESALQAIMTKATRIPDILEVQAQLTGVRQQIEQLAAQKVSLEKQAALATLTVGFALPPAVAVTLVQEGWDPAAEVDQAAATLVGLGQGVASATIWVAIVLLPLALILGSVLGVAWLVVRRVRPRVGPPAPGAPLDVPAA